MYIIYSIYSFFNPSETEYNMYVALAIATFTFAEIGINIRGVIINRRNHEPLMHAVKMISLASSLICLVLTQKAILSFSAETPVDPAFHSLMGVLMGVSACIIGIIMIRRIKS